jgi:ACS family D-galactonate transporter-like MFS transporter
MPVSAIPRVSRSVPWSILILLVASQMIAYIDRVNLSVAAPVFIRQYHWSTTEIGVLFSIFNWVFTIALLGAGPFVDWLRARIAYPVGLGLWSVATMLCGLSAAFAPLAVFRAFVGIGEAPMIPAGQRVIVEIFPKEQGTRAVAAFFAGNKIGLAVGIPFAAVILSTFGLPWVFYITGALGIVWVAWFLAVYREPPRRAETKSTIRWSTLLRYRNTWGIMIATGGYLYMYYVFATWLPGYLVIQRHMSILNSGWIGMLPFILAVITTLVGGWVADVVIARGWRKTVARKSFAVGGLVLATIFTLLGAYAENVWVAVTFLILAVGSFSFATPSIQSMSVDIAPRHVLSSLVSLQNFGGNVGGSFAPVITGMLISRAGNFTLPLLVTAGVALVFGCGSILFLIGDLDHELAEQRSPLGSTPLTDH